MQHTLCKVLILLLQIHRIVSSNYLKSVLRTTSCLIAHCGHDNLVFLANLTFLKFPVTYSLCPYVLRYLGLCLSWSLHASTLDSTPATGLTRLFAWICHAVCWATTSCKGNTQTNTYHFDKCWYLHLLIHRYSNSYTLTLHIFCLKSIPKTLTSSYLSHLESTDKRDTVFQICSAQGRTWTSLFQMIPSLLFIMSEDFMSHPIFVDCACDLSLEWLVLQNMTLWPLIDQYNTHNWLHKITQQTFSKSGLIDAWLIDINVL